MARLEEKIEELKRTFFKMLLYMVVAFTSIIVIISVIIGVKIAEAKEEQEIERIKETSKLHTSKVVDYEFTPKNRNAIKLADGTLFEEDTISINGVSNFKSQVKLNCNSVKAKPKVTYAKKENKGDEMYYIYKVE